MRTSFHDRIFQLWEYRVSHGSLLIRSPKTPEISTNIDLVCVGVEYLAAPRHIQGLELVEASMDEIGNLSRALGKGIDPPNQLRMIISAGIRFPIVAVSFRFHEHEEDIFYSPFD